MEEMLRKSRLQRLIAGVIALVLSLSLLTAATLVWRDYSQQKNAQTDHGLRSFSSAMYRDQDRFSS